MEQHWAASVDPFVGCEASQLDGKTGLAATWFWPKAQIGNLHPGACLPLSALSVCAYSGGYPTGYGRYRVNTHGRPPLLHAQPVASGLTHFQPSGTGAIGNYYNYLHCAPVLGPVASHRDYRPLLAESARPGYYAATLGAGGPACEVGVAPWAAHHRYRFPGDAARSLVLDLVRSGLDPAQAEGKMAARSEAVRLAFAADGTVDGCLRCQGLDLYFSLRASSGRPELRGDGRPEAPPPAAGTTLDPARDWLLVLTGVAAATELRIGFSCRSAGQAAAARAALEAQSFADTCAAAERQWDEVLGRIRVTAAGDERRLFYTMLYHALKKPCALTGHGPLGEADHWVDLATLWDQHKTQLPLVQSLLPEQGAAICRGLIELGERYGSLPIGHLLQGFAGQREIFRDQARCLGHTVLCDGFLRGLPGVDWQRTLAVMAADVRQQPASIADGSHPRPTHVLDVSVGAACTQTLAKALGAKAEAAAMRPFAQLWRRVYDPHTGLLKAAGEYYEGTLWNYSFRLAPWARQRLALFGSEERALATLDHFFGFSRGPCTQCLDPRDQATMRTGFDLHSFEGMNNEPDMETPFLYHYLGRPDRCNDVVDAVLRQQYQLSRNGLPGNDDSGGLSSWYVWNALGLFPVAGQDRFLVGRPLFPEARLALGTRSLTIKAGPIAPAARYLRSLRLNGRRLNRYWLTWSELQDAELHLEMSETPA